MWKRRLAIALATSIIGLITWPHVVGACLPPLLLLLSWLATRGPNFAYSPRHPDINAVRNSPAMRAALLRPWWTPRQWGRVGTAMFITLVLAPGIVVGFWPVLFGTATTVSPARVIWCVMMIPLIMGAATFILESLIQQTVATPFVGLMIIAGVFLAPLMMGSDYRPELRPQRWPVTIMFSSCALIALWLMDMLRLNNPLSPRYSGDSIADAPSSPPSYSFNAES